MGLRRTLVIVQVSVSVVVLATGFLFLRNLLNPLRSAPASTFNTRCARTSTCRPARTATPAGKAFYAEQVVRELESIPGIESAAAARIVPFTDSTRFGSQLTFLGSGETKHAQFHWNAVSPRYFQVLSIPVISGRSSRTRTAELRRP